MDGEESVRVDLFIPLQARRVGLCAVKVRLGR